MKKFLGLLIIFAITMGFYNNGYAQNYKVIVNTDNQIDKVKRSELNQIFLKKVSKWEDGTKIKPINLDSDSDVREAFTKNVHKKSVSAIKAYWQKQIFTGKGVPPVEKSSDKDVIEYVKSNPGAVGYVSGNATAYGVKTIEITN